MKRLIKGFSFVVLLLMGNVGQAEDNDGFFAIRADERLDRIEIQFGWIRDKGVFRSSEHTEALAKEGVYLIRGDLVKKTFTMSGSTVRLEVEGEPPRGRGMNGALPHCYGRVWVDDILRAEFHGHLHSLVRFFGTLSIHPGSSSLESSNTYFNWEIKPNHGIALWGFDNYAECYVITDDKITSLIHADDEKRSRCKDINYQVKRY